jgi:hypothetical protein
LQQEAAATGLLSRPTEIVLLVIVFSAFTAGGQRENPREDVTRGGSRLAGLPENATGGTDSGLTVF